MEACIAVAISLLPVLTCRNSDRSQVKHRHLALNKDNSLDRRAAIQEKRDRASRYLSHAKALADSGAVDELRRAASELERAADAEEAELNRPS